jgi:hypothetical protein
MSVNLTINGQVYAYPEQGDAPGWGTNATDWATAVTTGMLQKAGGLFILLDDVDFGANFGLIAKYYESRSASPSQAGVFRLGNDETLGWRNFADAGDLELGVDSSDQLTFNGSPIQGGISVSDTSTINLTFAGNVLSADIVSASITNALISASAAIDYSKLNLTGSIVNADVSASAAIARSKVASGTAYRVLANDSSGALSENAVLTAGRVVYPDINGQLTGEAAFTYNASTNTLSADNFVGGLTGYVEASDLWVTGSFSQYLTDDSVTTGSNANFVAVTGFVRLSNASLASVATVTRNGPSSSASETFILTNATGNSINIVNQAGAGTAAERIITGTGANLTVADGASIILVYDNVTNRWRVVGGSGGGGSSPAIGGAITGGTDNAVLFVDPAATLAQDASFFSYDNATHKLTLGAAPIFSSLTTAGVLHNAGTTGQVSSSLIVDADVSSSAAITRSKTASGTAYRILANNSSGVMSENAALTAGRIVYPDANGQLTGEAALSYNASTDTLSTVNITGSSGGQISYPGSGTSSEHFGALSSVSLYNEATAVGSGATVSGDDTVALGYAATASNTSAVAIGAGSTSFGEGAIAIGTSSTSIGPDGIAIGNNASSASDSGSIAIGGSALTSSAANSVAIGESASVSGDQSVALGASSSTSGGSATALGFGANASSDAIAIGFGATATNAGICLGKNSGAQSSQFVAGSVDQPISTVYFGDGAQSSSPTIVTINGTGAQGTNIGGGDIKLAAGKSTGNATPASVKIQSTTVGSTGTSQQTLSDVAVFNSSGLQLKKQALQLDPYTTGAGNTSEIRFMELAVNGSNYVGFKAPDSISANKVWILPNADGSTGQVLKTDGSLGLGWASALTNPMSNAGEMIYGGVSGAPTAVSAGSSGNLLMSNGTSAPTFTNTITGAKTFSGTFTGSGGIITGSGGTPNSTGDSNYGTISSVTNTAYYEGSFTASFVGSWAVSHNVTVSYVKTGKIVVLSFPESIFAGSNPGLSSINTAASAVPSNLRPSVAKKTAVNVYNNAAAATIPGELVIFSDGSIYFYRQADTTTLFTATANCGWYGDVTITYLL